jgi:hypothetical protein
VEHTVTQLEKVFNSEQPELFAEELRPRFDRSADPRAADLIEY